jgi:predicted Fe-Mo cluster-binding NifX family protein
MIIAISSTGKGIDSQVDPRFGRCDYFILINDGLESTMVISNTAKNSQSGSGTLASTLISDGGADVILTGNVGPNAYRSLEAAGVEIYTGAAGTIAEAYDDYLNGKLPQAAGPTSRGRH